MIKENQRALNQINGLTDALILFPCMAFAYFIRFDLFHGIPGHVGLSYYMTTILCMAPLFWLMYGLMGLYDSFRSKNFLREFSLLLRSNVILFGVLLLTACFGSGYVYTLFNNTFHPALYALFALVGVAWASINVNSLPMVVEMCKGSDVGKFTGYYYTASMAAQTITPIVAGWLLKHVSYSVLFLYSAIFVGLAFFTMLMVRHGDVKVEAKRGLEAFDVDD